MPLISLIYTSLAALGLQTGDLEAIQRIARVRNAHEGITGLLIFNGTHFLQIVEGREGAVDALVERLRGDPRHIGFEIRDRHRVAERSFPDWPLEMVRVNAGYFDARETITDRLPETVSEPIKLRLLRMTELISKMHFPD